MPIAAILSLSGWRLNKDDQSLECPSCFRKVLLKYLKLSELNYQTDFPQQLVEEEISIFNQFDHHHRWCYFSQSNAKTSGTLIIAKYLLTKFQFDPNLAVLSQQLSQDSLQVETLEQFLTTKAESLHSIVQEQVVNRLKDREIVIQDLQQNNPDQQLIGKRREARSYDEILSIVNDSLEESRKRARQYQDQAAKITAIVQGGYKENQERLSKLLEEFSELRKHGGVDYRLIGEPEQRVEEAEEAQEVADESEMSDVTQEQVNESSKAEEQEEQGEDEQEEPVEETKSEQAKEEQQEIEQGQELVVESPNTEINELQIPDQPLIQVVEQQEAPMQAVSEESAQEEEENLDENGEDEQEEIGADDQQD